MKTPERIIAKIDYNGTYDGIWVNGDLPLPLEFDLGRDAQYVRADLALSSDELRQVKEALTYFAQWDHCWPGNINLETAVSGARAALAILASKLVGQE